MNEFSLGEWLRDARAEKELSLRALAAQLDIAPSYLSDIENDRRVPAEEVLLKLTEALGLDFEEAMVRAGRFGEDAERYLKRQPEAVRLLRRVSAANLDAEALRRISDEVAKSQEKKEAEQK